MVWPEKNEFPVPQWKWRDAEDRASKYHQLFDLAEQEIMDLNQKLAVLLGGRKIIPDKPPTGTGMVDQAAQQLAGRAYQLHVQEAKAMGQQPLTPEQFAAQQK